MNVNEARKLAAKHTEIGLNKLYEIIKNKATNGEYGATVSTSIISGNSEKIREQLVAQGYKVTVVSDQRDGSYYDISWQL